MPDSSDTRPEAAPVEKTAAALKQMPQVQGEANRTALQPPTGVPAPEPTGDTTQPTKSISQTDDASGGRWVVHGVPLNDAFQDDIFFGLRPATDSVPAEQVKLKSEVEKTLTLLRAIFPDRTNNLGQKARFSDYFRKLLSLSQVALTPRNPNPEVATYALLSVHQEIVELEGGRIKNTYMRRLGRA